MNVGEDIDNRGWLLWDDGDNRLSLGTRSAAVHYPTSLTVKDGKVGIGQIDPAFPLEMGSGAHVTAGGVWTDASSRDYKENIRDLTSEAALATLKKLSPKQFSYKTEKNEMYLGFIAEEVPDLVATQERKGLVRWIL